MVRFGALVPNSCPACGTAPYPHGIACKTCGFIGEKRSGPSRRQSRVAFGFFIVALATGVFVMFSLLTTGSRWPF